MEAGNFFHGLCLVFGGALITILPFAAVPDSKLSWIPCSPGVILGTSVVFGG
jgi:hypothetical protein